MSSDTERMALAARDLRRLLSGWRPVAADLVGAVRLINWLPVHDEESGYIVLIGDAVEHPVLGTTFITTSPLIWLDQELALARTVSRWYRLSNRVSASPSLSTTSIH